jgi:hypothetical protein
MRPVEHANHGLIIMKLRRPIGEKNRFPTFGCRGGAFNRVARTEKLEQGLAPA